ncbi:MAG: hypothetical protein CM15mP120_09650 [Pseudomonadota bacterium]|nr:MAG: hypothetical protein CM15mP120_09650 [Pseudomonadota bacterium]
MPEVGGLRNSIVGEMLADKLGVILVQPVGYKLPHNEGAWQLDTHGGRLKTSNS